MIRKEVAMKKYEFVSNFFLYFLYSIMMIILGIRVAMTYVLEGPLLVLYLIVTFVVIYSIIGHGIKIYRYYKKD